MLLRVFRSENDANYRDLDYLIQNIEESGYRVEVYDLDDYETAGLKEIYDIYSSPTLMINDDFGKVIEIWRSQIPTESEVKNYLRI